MLRYILGLLCLFVVESVATCMDDPDFVYNYGTGTRKLTKSGSKKSSKKGPVTCDSIRNLSAKKAKKLCKHSKNDGAAPIRDACPVGCGVCEFSTLITTPNPDACPTAEDIVGIVADADCNSPAGNCRYNLGNDGNPYAESVLDYECTTDSVWRVETSFECPATREEYESLFVGQNLEVSSNFPYAWRCEYLEPQAEPQPNRVDIMEFAYFSASALLSSSLLEDRFSCPEEEIELETLLDEAANEVCNDSNWSCSYGDRTYECRNGELKSGNTFQCPTRLDDLETLLDNNAETGVCTDVDWKCKYGNTLLKCTDGVPETRIAGALLAGSEPPSIENPSVCPPTSPLGGECDISPDIECKYIRENPSGSQPNAELVETAECADDGWIFLVTRPYFRCPDTQEELEARIVEICTPEIDWRCGYVYIVGNSDSGIGFGCQEGFPWAVLSSQC